MKKTKVSDHGLKASHGKRFDEPSGEITIRTGLHSFTSESLEGLPIVNWQLYDTIIVRLFKNLIQLNHGTHKTKHCKRCMNSIIEPLGFRVKQKAGNWLVELPTSKEIRFKNHMTIEDKRTKESKK